ncbi:MAG: efflux transporter outer membrane subunit [Novosphingobium sp.]
MRTSLFLTAMASTVLSGCNLAPQYVRPPAAAPAQLPHGGVYPGAGPVVPSDARDLTKVGWRDFFEDERLKQVIQLGLDNNQDLELAAAHVLQARAQYRVQRAQLLPTIQASGSATFTNSAAGAGRTAGGAGTGTGGAVAGRASPDVEIYNAQVGVSAFEVDLFGRIRNLNKAALQQYFASEEAQRTARISLIAEIATAWATLASDRDQLALSEKTLVAFKQTLDLTNAQFRIGVASELESRQAETNYQATRNDIAVLRTRIAQDRNALDLLVGTTVADNLLPSSLENADVAIDALPANLSSGILLQRPDVLQAEHQLIAQNANIGAARAAFFPTISLTATLGTISSALSGLFDHGTGIYTATPSIGLPLVDGGRNKGNLDYARASQRAAVATYQKTIQTAFREVADALAQRGTIDEQVAAQTERVHAAGIAANLSGARYRAGIDSFLTSLDSQRTAYAAEQQLGTETQAANSGDETIIILESLLCVMREKNLLTRADIERLCEKVERRATGKSKLPAPRCVDAAVAAMSVMQQLSSYIGQRYGGKRARN